MWVTFSHYIFKNFSIRKVSTRIPYEMPDRYRNSFYLANASLFDRTNWFLHRAYEIVVATLINEYGLSKKFDENARKVEELIHKLDQCNAIIDIRFPIERDNGKMEMVRAFRAHYGLASGYSPCIGGLRVHLNITRDMMKGFAVLATYRNACMGINLSGAFGGIKIDPSTYSEKELKSVIQNYALELVNKGFLKKSSDVFLPDINTSEIEMDWMFEALGKDMNTAVTGKSEINGGVPSYKKAASLSAFYSLKYFLNDPNVLLKLELAKGLKGKTFIIQGLGKLGQNLALLLVNKGLICVGVKEKDAYIYDKNGINLMKLLEYRQKNGTLTNFETAKPYNNDDIYKEACDILIFAACERSLNCYMADKVKAKIILETADAAISPTSHKILLGQSKLVIPDLIGCSGAAIASYLEFLLTLAQLNPKHEIFNGLNPIYQNYLLSNVTTHQELKIAIGSKIQRQMPQLSCENILNNLIEDVILERGKEILNLLKIYNLGLDLRSAAYILAIQNIFKSKVLRNIK